MAKREEVFNNRMTGLNKFGSVNFLVGDSAKELKEQLSQISQPFNLITIYPQGSKHYAWIFGDVKVVPRKSMRNVNNLRQE